MFQCNMMQQQAQMIPKSERYRQALYFIIDRVCVATGLTDSL